MHYKSCTICGLKSGRKDGTKRSFMAKFPINEERCRLWVRVIGDRNLAFLPIEKLHNHKYVCKKHFKETDFKKRRTRLKKSAVPSKFLNNPPLDDDILAVFPVHIEKKNKVEFGKYSIFAEHNYCKSSVCSRIPHNPGLSTTQEYGISENISIKTFSETLPLSTKNEIIVEFIQDPDLAEQSYCESSIFESELPCSYDLSLSNEYDVADVTDEFDQTLPPNTKEIDLKIKSKQNRVFAEHNYSELSLSRRKTQRSLGVSAPKNYNIPEKNKMKKHAVLPTSLPQKRKLLKQIQKYKSENMCLKKRLKKYENIESPVLKSLIEAHTINQNRKPQGKRWTTLSKSVALDIYKKSPKAFEYLSQILPLPSI